ncbi:large conductance mechanosensitive channel protein MscL [Microbacterium oryzae]|uniref:large conductance mechanosensitive channel protein MscL n=1 Tax=Microbacterium oryzae TaxID=743009 RepID=UPI0025B02BA2|nr:large conductance mechanosensitive channel protein MscL [Microbacterium oryzae]MDN3311027.1 large conductance mechanosensitive channel protein MscL [Microbacterium oryzae]
MLQGFRDFILRGNVVELAVAVVIGTAFNAIVTVLVEALINPLIALFFDASSLQDALQVTVPTLLGGESTSATFAFGAVLAAVINFLVVAAAVYFVIVLPMNKVNEMRKARAGVVEEAVPAPTQEQLLTEIRDLLAQRSDR